MATLRKFRSLEEIKQYLTVETKVALEDTLKAMIPKLRYFIDECVYWAYHPVWYKRTRWLKRRSDVIEHYISTLQGRLNGGIRISNKIYNSVSDRKKFQHGNPYRPLSAESFLEILNGEDDVDWLFNPFGFPMIQRESFWEKFLEWAKNDDRESYDKLFIKYCKRRGIDLNNLSHSTSGQFNYSSQSEPKEPSPEPPKTSVSDTQNDIGRNAIPQRAKVQGMYHFVNRFTGKSVQNNSENESILSQIARLEENAQWE